MEITTVPLELQLTYEPGMTASELETQCQNTYFGQKAIDDYFRGDIDEDTLIGILEGCDIDWLPLLDILETNLLIKYGIKA